MNLRQLDPREQARIRTNMERQISDFRAKIAHYERERGAVQTRLNMLTRDHANFGEIYDKGPSFGSRA